MNRFAFADEVRAVLFDAGNTLLCIDHGRLAAALAGAGIEVSEEAVRDAEIRARPRLDDAFGTAAKPETAELFRLFATFLLDGLGASRPPAQADAARDALVAEWPHMWSRVPEDADATLSLLARRGYRLAVVSNSHGTVREMLRAAGLLARFEFVVDSSEVGVWKPDPRIFAIAAERLGLAPGACAYVGDLHSIDVVGARAAGMHAVLVDPLGAWTKSDAAKVARLSEIPPRLA